MALGGCGIVLVGLLASWLWSKHEKTLKPWGDAYGVFAMLGVVWIVVSILIWIVVFASSSYE
jgi:uncharacterized membrane protein